MRKLLAALSLVGVIATPALATGIDDDLDALVERWMPKAPQSDWREIHRQPLDGRLGAMGAGRHGAGWAALDGWMRGDPLLRHWVLHRFDLNGDVALSPAEAEAARRSFYAMADVNATGRITSEEFVIGWVQVRDEMRGFYALDVG